MSGAFEPGNFTGAKNILLMNGLLEEISINDFDLSLSEFRFSNPEQSSKIEQQMWLSGQLQPLVVRPVDDKYQIIDGFKRYYAALEMNVITLRGYVMKVTLQQAKVLMLSYNRFGRSLEAWEEALILLDLTRTHNLSQYELAKITGYSRSWVCRRLSLLSRLDQELIPDLKLGSISSSHARALIKLPRGNQMAVANVVISMKLNYQQCNTLVDALCKAGTEEKYQYILDHPEEIIAEKMPTQLRSYEDFNPDLGDFANELEDMICDAAILINNLLTHLQSDQVGRLKEQEKEILSKDFLHLCDAAQNLIQTTTELSIKSI